MGIVMDKKRATKATQGRDGKATLVLDLVDQNRKAVTARSKVFVARVGDRKAKYRGSGKTGAVTRFTFELPAGDYSIDVDADGFERRRDLVTVHAGHRRLHELRLDWESRGEGEKGERALIDARLHAFRGPRAQGHEHVPPDGRLKALEHKKRMLDPEVTNAPLVVKPIADPSPLTSLCSIGAWVDVHARDPKPPFARALLKIPYREDHLGWVDPATLRVFAFDPASRRLTLVEESGSAVERRWAWAYIDRPGIYGVIGLPRDQGVRATVRAFGELMLDGKRSAGSQHERICHLVLCAEAGKRLKPPGGFTGTACDLCTQLQNPPGGLPEQQLFDGSPPPPTPGPPPSGACSWVSIGPRNINGRVTALAVHPGMANYVFAGTANAGVWASRDAGVSWKPLMFQEGALEIGALAVHLSDPSNPTGDVTIYAATGERRAFVGFRGIGILKSTASGAAGTWMSTGSIPGPGGYTFTCLAIDDTTVTVGGASVVAYAGCPGGLYKTTNGGGEWTQVLNKDVMSVVLDPTNSQIIYAGVNAGGIYKYDPSTSSWSTFNTGFTTPYPMLVAIDIGRSAPHQMYAKLDQTVYKYNNAMSTWQSLGNHGGETYGYWNNYVAVDPSDSKIIFVGGIATERTYDGGTTWQSPGFTHDDQHDFAFDSGNHLQVYNGNDGGVYVGAYTSASDTGAWTKRSNGLTISHLNSVGGASQLFGVSPGVSDLVGCGVQDNGTIRTAGCLTWDSLPIGGDGSDFLIDPANQRILYVQFTTVGVNSHPYKSIDGGQTFSPADSGFADGPFVGRMALDANSPPEPNRVLYAAGTTVVMRSVNSAGSWSVSSPALGGAPTALAVAPSTSAIVLAGTNTGRVWRSSDGGATTGNWHNVTTGTIAGSAGLPGRQVSRIVVHPTDPNTVYVAFTGFNGSAAAHVFVGTSSDGWLTWKWTDISSNLPDIPVTALEIKRPAASPVTLWAGTDTGVFQTTDSGISWAPFDVGLPNCAIVDLALNGGGDVLRAAAYGYGMWEIHLGGSSCPQMDIYIRDNKLDAGEENALSGVQDPTQGSGFVNWWESVDIKTDAWPYQTAPVDGVDFDHFTHVDPVVNDSAHPNANKLYVQVINRGPMADTNVKVKPLYANASMGLPSLPNDFWATYPGPWTTSSSWAPVDASVPFQTIPRLDPHTPAILTWNWTVPTTAHEHTCMFVVISGDNDNVTRSDLNPNDHLLWIVAPQDKHAALHNLHVVGGSSPIPPPGGTGGGGGGAPAPHGVLIDLHNPLVNGDLFDVVFDPGTLPKASRFSLLLPALPKHVSAALAEGRVPIATIGAKTWWHQTRVAKRAWKHELELSKAIAHDHRCGRPVATVSGLFIPAQKHVVAAVVIATPNSTPPGAVYRCSIAQRSAETIVGGSTFEVRIPPAEVVVK
jgi:hypothetical protein